MRAGRLAACAIEGIQEFMVSFVELERMEYRHMAPTTVTLEKHKL